MNRFLNRLWDVKEHKMIYGVKYCPVEKAFYTVNKYGAPEKWFALRDGHIPMQCIALKDKRGCMICEGDILRYGARIRIVSSFGYGAQLVFPEIPALSAFTKGFELFIKNSEIVGTIYENPELVKGTPYEQDP